MNWLLFSYRVPAQPSAVRVAIWRDLRQHGAVAVGTGLYALPDRDTYLDVLAQLTERVSHGGGSAVAFRATALAEADERMIADAFATARREEYLQIVKSARKLGEHIDREDQERDYRFAEVESLEEELQKVRRQLALVVMRDVGPEANHPEARAAIEQAAGRLQEYLEHAYRHDRDARSSGEADE